MGGVQSHGSPRQIPQGSASLKGPVEEVQFAEVIDEMGKGLTPARVVRRAEYLAGALPELGPGLLPGGRPTAADDKDDDVSAAAELWAMNR